MEGAERGGVFSEAPRRVQLSHVLRRLAASEGVDSGRWVVNQPQNLERHTVIADSNNVTMKLDMIPPDPLLSVTVTRGVVPSIPVTNSMSSETAQKKEDKLDAGLHSAAWAADRETQWAALALREPSQVAG